MRLGIEIGHHMLDTGVILKSILREVLAVARVLEATVGHLRDHRDVGVDPHAAEVQVLGHAQRAADVAGPHARGQAVLDAVGPGQSLRLSVPASGRESRDRNLRRRNGRSTRLRIRR